MTTPPSAFEVMSTRLFPPNQGVEAYRITGVANRCDWVILTDKRSSHVAVHKRSTEAPATIFLSLRHPYRAISYFAREILPMLEQPFVLISGSSDVTLPNQRDKRFKTFADEQGHIQGIAAHRLLRHWFCENLDEAFSSKVSPLPLGLTTPDPVQTMVSPPDSPPLPARQSRAFCAHRVRQGAQWQRRKSVTQWAKTHWQDCTTVIDEELTEPDFVKQLQQHAFVLCVDGGGIDPSPKAWLSLLNGAIPIIRRTALEPAYKELPVAFVDDWHPGCISTEMLGAWAAELASRMDAFRADNMSRLSLDYWWTKIRNSDGACQF